MLRNMGANPGSEGSHPGDERDERRATNKPVLRGGTCRQQLQKGRGSSGGLCCSEPSHTTHLSHFG